jgi:hypothetical protein
MQTYQHAWILFKLLKFKLTSCACKNSLHQGRHLKVTWKELFYSLCKSIDYGNTFMLHCDINSKLERTCYFWI